MRSQTAKGLRQFVFVVLLISGTQPSFAESLIRFPDGRQAKTEELLGQGYALIYVEKSCSACALYLRDLEACPETIRSKLRVVSISSPVQTIEMSRKLPGWVHLYVLKDTQGARPVSATPTTRTVAAQKVGILSCEDVEEMIPVNSARRKVRSPSLMRFGRLSLFAKRC